MRPASLNSADERQCATRYPILLVHGVSLRDGHKLRIWGRIPQSLQSLGARVYMGGQDGWGTPENNARQLREKVATILSDTGAQKVNIIAHSKGGIDTRHLIKMYLEEGRADQDLPIASLTTIATPHLGSQTLDFFYWRFRPAFRLIAFFINSIYRQAGDEHPDFYGVCNSLTSTSMQAFNQQQHSGLPIYSQQFASSLRGLRDSLVSLFTYPIISRIEGANDGLVALNSAALDNFRGEILTAKGRGIAHAGLVDIMRNPFKTKARAQVRENSAASKPRQESGVLFVNDIIDLYIAIAIDLKDRGY